MKIIDSYLARIFLHSRLSVHLILVGLLSFFELAKQLDDIGVGRYRLIDALLYVLLTLPGRMLEMAPPSALLGSIMALGLLTKNAELTALRASGISIQRIGWAFVRPAMFTLFALLLVAQFIIPYLEQTAWIRRETALTESVSILPRGGLWTREGKRFIHLNTTQNNQLQDADIYEFDESHQLTRFIHARETQIGTDGSWNLRDVQLKEFTGQGGQTEKQARLVLPNLLTKKQAAVFALPAQTLSLTELYSIITNLEKREQNAGRYRLALWQKLCLPLMAAAMIMISIPFVCGPARSASIGWNIMVGAIIGVVFFFLNQILGYSGLILQLSPFWTTLFPALVLLMAGIFLTRKLI